MDKIQSMTYEETLTHLYAQLPMFSRIGAAAYKEDLHNTIALLDSIGNPQHNFKSIHIAGTNGKGSTSHMLAAMLQQQGYNTGLYTSPHIHDFRERIRINGIMIEKEFVVAFTERIKKITAAIQPSFFEVTVAMAFSYFSEKKIDIAVIETGMGGRLDSTNVITPLLSVITNIGLDHTAFLGDSIPLIAAEKAGIIKPRVPVVIGEKIEGADQIFIAKAAETQSDIFFAEDYFEIDGFTHHNNFISCTIQDKKNEHQEVFEMDLTGSYQLKNIKTVLMAESVLQHIGININKENEKIALRSVKKITGIQGRWDKKSSAPDMYFDVAHNQEGIKEILAGLAKQYPNNHCHFVLGFVKDKLLEKVMQILPSNASYYFTNAQIPRALNCTELQQIAAGFGLHGDAFNDVNEAIASAKKNAAKSDVIIVCGSFFILSDISE
jgi:dihydrofolate synthase/folylpolyglutamate synthase